MPPTTPYSADLDGRDPLTAIRDTAARIRALAGEWTPGDFERSYAPGKWSGRQILTHLAAQSEIAFANRVRMALTTSAYVAQPFDQDRWMDCESTTSGQDALDAFLGLAAMNASLFDKSQPHNGRSCDDICASRVRCHHG